MNSRKKILTALISLLLLVTGKQIIWAQSGAGSIQGTVTDSTGAVIPGASVQVSNDATGVVANTKSNGAGFYQVPDLFTGPYTVTATAPGMDTYKTSVNLLVAQDAVINPVLAPGKVTQQVVVTGNAVQLTTTDNGAITSALENARINQLPMNVRLLTTLIGETTPGIVMEGGTEPHVNGLALEALEFTIDGATTSNDFYGGPYNQKVASIDPDSVQEVQMETTSSGAQYASPSTGIISTKSGTNQVHGTAFETARNNAIGVAKDRQDPVGFSAPHLVRNEFGASAGGPIILPHIYHGKDKSFWFLAYERYSYATDSAGLYKVPTPAMSQGNFSGLINGSGVLQVLFDPSTTKNSTSCLNPLTNTSGANTFCRTAFPGNQIPIGELSPTAKIYYQLLPQPTTAADPLVTTNLTALSHSFQLLPQETLRLDHEFNANNKAYLRFSNEISNTNTSGAPESLAVGSIPAGAAEGYTNGPLGTMTAAVGYTHIFSPTFFAETLASQEWFFFSTLTGNAANLDYESMLGLPNNFGEVGFPALGNATLINSLTASQSNKHESQKVFTLDENLTKVAGRNQMQFGGRFRQNRGTIQPAGTNDTIPFGALPTALYNTSSGANYTGLTNTGYADASFFLGSANSYNITHQAANLNFQYFEFDGYLQDNYHLSRNLTVNVGLRYEAHPALAWQKYNLANSFDLKNDAMVFAVPVSTLISEGYTTQAIITNDENIGVKFETASQAGMPANTLLRNYNLNFLPRAGLAYQPFGGRFGTVIRGAYGRYAYETPLTYYITGPAKNNPLVASYTQSYLTAAQAVDALPNELLRYNDPVQFGEMGVNTANAVNSSTTNAILPGISLYSDSPTWPPDFATETNFTIEQPLKGNSVLRVSWIWTHTTNLDIGDNYNNHPTNYEWEMAYGVVPPTGGASVIGTPLQNTYSTTATGPYDQTTWGGSSMHTKNGWSNDNSLQVNFQRLFHHGAAYQFTYVFSRPLVVGGDQSFSVDPDANYPGVLGTVATMTSPYGTVQPGVAPPARPSNLPAWADYQAMDRFQGYSLDNSTPEQHITFNGIIDLPVGRGKWLLGNASRLLDEIVGGYQLAGDFSLQSQTFQPNAGNWGPTNPIQIYKHRYPITDCRSGVCEKSYMWFNGYLAPTVTTGVQGSVCTTNCVTGLPSNYAPALTPIDNTPGTTYYGDNEVSITAPGLNSGKATAIVYDGGPQGSSYLSNSWINGPINYTEDISIFKVFPITEKTNLRVNADAFNALNVQGWNNPGTGGVQNNLSSANLPREIQLTARFTF